MNVCHKQAMTADFGTTNAASIHTAVNGDAFTYDRMRADFKRGRFAREGQCRSILTDTGKLENLYTLTYSAWPFDNDV
jgi:hypothetical protein